MRYVIFFFDLFIKKTNNSTCDTDSVINFKYSRMYNEIYIDYIIIEQIFSFLSMR